MVQIVERVSHELPPIYWVGWFMFIHSEKNENVRYLVADCKYFGVVG